MHNMNGVSYHLFHHLCSLFGNKHETMSYDRDQVPLHPPYQCTLVPQSQAHWNNQPDQHKPEIISSFVTRHQVYFLAADAACYTRYRISIGNRRVAWDVDIMGFEGFRFLLHEMAAISVIS